MIKNLNIYYCLYTIVQGYSEGGRIYFYVSKIKTAIENDTHNKLQKSCMPVKIVEADVVVWPSSQMLGGFCTAVAKPTRSAATSNSV